MQAQNIKRVVAVLAALFAIVLIYNWVSSSDPPYATNAKNYYLDISKSQFGNAYNALCSQKRASISAAGLQQAQQGEWKQLVDQLGPLKQIKISGWSHSNKNVAVVEMRFEFAHATRIVQANMANQSGSWRFCGGTFVAKSGVSS